MRHNAIIRLFNVHFTTTGTNTYILIGRFFATLRTSYLSQASLTSITSKFRNFQLTPFSVGKRVSAKNKSPGILASVRFIICCVLFSMLPWRSVGRSNFDSGLHYSIMLILENDIKMKIKLPHKKYNQPWKS